MKDKFDFIWEAAGGWWTLWPCLCFSFAFAAYGTSWVGILWNSFCITGSFIAVAASGYFRGKVEVYKDLREQLREGRREGRYEPEDYS